MISIEEMEAMLDEIAAEIPREFYRELNGGIILLPEEKPHPQSRNGDLYTLGEYHLDGGMGRFIAIYYGSFSRVYGDLPKGRLKAQLKKTLRHEFRHHLESLAGERDLEIEDEQNIAEYIDRSRPGHGC